MFVLSFFTFLYAVTVSGGAVLIYYLVDRAEASHIPDGMFIYALLMLWLGASAAWGVALTAFKFNQFNRSGLIFATVINFCVGVPLMYAAVYRAFEVKGLKCIKGGSSDSYFDAIYFSYTTFTTLGYGDLTPERFCRVLTSSEALLGYIFLGLLIAMIIDTVQANRKAFVKEYIDLTYKEFSQEAKKIFDPVMVDQVIDECLRKIPKI
ncbi:MAG: two pore domain potassium channel family protein [Loktanella sp.]|nr:two pore domain potassium channel family protein [Loktanella sp.]